MVPVAEQHGGEERRRGSPQVEDEPFQVDARGGARRGRVRCIVAETRLVSAAMQRLPPGSGAEQHDAADGNEPSAVGACGDLGRQRDQRHEARRCARVQTPRTHLADGDTIADAGVAQRCIVEQDAAQFVHLVQRQAGAGTGAGDALAELGAAGKQATGRRGQQQAPDGATAGKHGGGRGEAERRTAEQQHRVRLQGSGQVARGQQVRHARHRRGDRRRDPDRMSPCFVFHIPTNAAKTLPLQLDGEDSRRPAEALPRRVMMARMAAPWTPAGTGTGSRDAAGRGALGALARLGAVYLALSLPALLVPLPRTLAAAALLAALQAGIMLPILRCDTARAAVDWRVRGRDAGEALLIAAAMVAALAAASALLGTLPESAGEVLRRGHRWRLERVGQAPLAAVFVVAGAYREESYFRAYCLTLLRDSGAPAWLATLGSALLFGAGHLYQGWAAAGFAVLMGAALALLFQQRPSLHRVALAHALFNGAVLAATLLRA